MHDVIVRLQILVERTEDAIMQDSNMKFQQQMRKIQGTGQYGSQNRSPILSRRTERQCTTTLF